MSQKKFKMRCDGMFYSTLLYCIPLFTNIWGLPSMDDTMRRSQAFTKEDCRRLQVIQNKVLRCKTGKYHYRTPTASLLEDAKDMSIHQIGAYHTLVTVARMLKTQRPEYFARRLNLRKPSAAGVFPLRQLNTINVECNLSISRCGFSYRAAKLWNCLPENVRSISSMKAFKLDVKKWIAKNIALKPS